MKLGGLPFHGKTRNKLPFSYVTYSSRFVLSKNYFIMKNIQFITDYSPHSRQVFHYALHLAHHFGATLTATHIFAPVFPAAVDDFTEMPGLNAGDQLEKFLNTEWDRERERMGYFLQEHTPREFKDVPIRKEIGYGHPADEILRMQESIAFDLVVMGMNTRDTFVKNLIGATALSMIDHAKIPILLIPPTAQFQGIQRILFPTSLHLVELNMVDFLLEWTRAFQAKLFCFHTHFTDAKEGDDFSDCLIAAKQQFSAAMKREEVEFVVIEGKRKELAENIEKETGLLNADLLVMQTHNRGLFSHLFEESTTKEVASDVFVPVLVLKGTGFQLPSKRLETRAKVA